MQTYHQSVQSLSHVQLFATPWTAAYQASLSITNSQSLLKLMSIESVIHPTLSFSVVPFSSCLQSFPASGSFPMSQGFPNGSDGKESACNVGNLGLIPWLERSPGEGHTNLLQYSCLEKPHRQRSLVGWST